jgi:hypothetical protein
MDYYVFRINENFKTVVDENILLMLIEKEKNNFYYDQIKYIISPISWEKVIKNAKQYFEDRDDIVINDYLIAFKRIDEEKYDELYITSNALRLHLEHEISPILTFLEEFNEKFVFIKDEYLLMNS